MRKKGRPGISFAVLLLMLLTCGWVVAKAGHQTKGAEATKEGVNRRIDRIITETFKEGEGVVNGVKVWRRVPPAQKNIEEIRRYGDEAVSALTNHLNADSDRERALVVEFLGLLGGRRIIPPLQTVIQRDDSPSIRILALRWITQAPLNSVTPIIREAARTDVDQRVREEAQNILRLSRPNN